MVHRKSTYKLMYKNYAPNVRLDVWQENNSIREKRKEEERSHQSIQDSESECECDNSEDEVDGAKLKVNTLQKKKSEKSSHTSTPIPILRFSPEMSPRRSSSYDTLNDSHNLHHDTTININDHSNDVPYYINTGCNSTSPEQTEKVSQLNKEYDLLPATALKEDTRTSTQPIQKPSKTPKGILRSEKYPITTKMSKTTMKSYYDKNKAPPYVPCGSGSTVRCIGEKTSYNAHLTGDQVHCSALNASSKRQKEIESIVQAQRKLTLDDWRQKSNLPDNVNHSSLFSSGRCKIYSKTKQPRIRTKSAPSRVQIRSSFCKYCGGKK